MAYGISGIIINPTQSALISSIVDKAELPYANGLLQTGRDGVKLLAPLTGAALCTVADGHVIALLDAATFLVAAACVWRAHPRPRRRREDADGAAPRTADGRTVCVRLARAPPGRAGAGHRPAGNRIYADPVVRSRIR